MGHRVIWDKVWVIIVAVIILVLAALAGILLRNSELMESLRYQFSEEPLRLGIADPIEILDPVRISHRGEKMVGVNLYEGLISFDPETLEPRPSLAASWEVSEDARVFSFKLRKDACFHSGRLVTAEDVKYSWERNLSAGLNAPSVHLLMPIRGVYEKVKGKAASVEGIEILNNQEIRVTLEQPNIGFLSRLGMPAFWVIDREVVQSEGNKFGLPGSASAGTGPFLLKEWQKNKLVILDKFSNYWGTKSRLSQAEFIQIDPQAGLKSFQEGKIDYLDELPSSELKNVLQDPVVVQMVKRTGLLDSYFYQFNFQNPIWGASVGLRQALNYAVNRTVIIDRLFGGVGKPLNSLMPAGFRERNWDPIPYEFNQPMAVQLLADAGYPGGKGLPALELAYNDLESHRIIAEELKQQLGQIGVNVILRPVPWKQYKADLAVGKYTCFRGGWSWEYPDPDDLFFNNFHSAQIGKTNYSFYRNQGVDDLLNSARMEAHDQKQRMEYYRQVEKQIAADAPLLWLFAWERVVLVSPKVHNLQVTALDLVPLHRVGLLVN